MAPGIHLGTFLLFCLVQAEHVCGSWAAQAQRQNGKAFVGFSQQDVGAGSSPRNQFRQASVSLGSAPSSSSSSSSSSISRLFNPAPVGSSGRTQTGPQPAPGGYAPVRSLQGGWVSKPNWRPTDSKLASAQGVPKKQLSVLSTSIASGSSVSVHTLKKKAHTDVSERRTWPGEGASASRHQSAAQKPPSRSSSMLGAGAPVPHNSVKRRTSATAPARRVSSQRRAKEFRQAQITSPENERKGNPNWSKLFPPVTGGTAQGSYKPTSNMASSLASYPRAPYKQNAAVFQPRGLSPPTSQRFGSSEQTPGSTSSVRAGSSPQRYAPTRTLNIPWSFGGSPIKRLKGSVVQKPQVKHTAASHNLQGQGVQQKPQVRHTAASLNLQGQGVHPESKWQRITRPRPTA
ncbi:flocculation protein FLO11-like isoform X2 [Scophthalmus maximus]|uniref:flocculation protein FLO11-like isoform X2 n=1 Tax=Scophthalmus maximus TaxID=52904 RepID=UPI001FA81DB1|nr:flocculation protein FLO11-like isoform X2 [Scophthalmus maximus]